MAKTARQIAASRRNIKKAQLASARKRRGTGKTRPVSHRSRGKNVKRAVVTVGAIAAIGAGAYAAHKGYGIHKRKNAAIREVKIIQRRNRTRLKLAKRAAAADPSNRRAKTLVRVHRRNLRITSSRSVHNAVIKRHTGRG